MIIGVISDTHDKLGHFDAALSFFQANGARTIVHCGDWKSIASLQFCTTRAAELGLTVYGVLGNNDRAVAEFLDYARLYEHMHMSEDVETLPLTDVRLAAYHGHHLPTRRRLLADTSYDIICLGHTHKPRIETTATQLIVNPGSTAFAIPRSSSWQPSVALIDTTNRTATLHYLPKI